MNTLTSNDDSTLPPVPELQGEHLGREGLCLTVVFHPDPQRIGERADFLAFGAGASAALGRVAPLFAAHDGAQRPLQEAHVSRVALECCWDEGQLQVRRVPGSSRCRVDGRELRDTLSLDEARLRRGVPLLLAHSVVLLLRIGPLEQGAALAGERGAHDGIVGSSLYTRNLRQRIRAVAEVDLDVLITGDTGTGKELVAQALHSASRRRDRPLVSVNMAAIPAELAAATLFGNSRGAYTGAERARPGHFREARGGTLFLDEVGDMPDPVQPLLLRALQQREIQVVGGAVETVDVRVISATDAALDEAAGGFRGALRYRLGAAEIALLPLREHPEDLGEILWHFLAREFRDLGRSSLLPDEGSADLLVARWADLFHRALCHHWPGNVRELWNHARQIALASEHSLAVPARLYQELDSSPVEAGAAGVAETGTAARRTMAAVSEPDFVAAWRACAYGIAAIAQQLGVSRQSVYRRISAHPDMCLATDVAPSRLADELQRCRGDIREAAARLRVSASGLRNRALQLGLLQCSSGA